MHQDSFETTCCTRTCCCFILTITTVDPHSRVYQHYLDLRSFFGMPAPPLRIPTIGRKATARVAAVVEAFKPALPRAGKRMPSLSLYTDFLPYRTCMGGLVYNVLYRTALTQCMFPFVATNAVFPLCSLSLLAHTLSLYTFSPVLLMFPSGYLPALSLAASR